MSVSRDIRLSVIAEVENYVEGMRKIPGVTDKAAAAAGVRLATQLGKAEAEALKSAQNAAAKAASSWSDAFTVAISPQDIKAAATAMWDLQQWAANARNEITDMATRSGVSAQTISGLKLAAEGAGLSIGDMEGSVKGLAMRLNSAERGSAKAQQALADIGITADDIANRNLDELFHQAAQGLAAIEDPGDRARAAMAAMGEQGGKLLQALSGSELQDFIDRAERFGVDVGPEAAEAAARWQRATADLNLVLEGTGTSLADTIGATWVLERATTGLVVALEAAAVLWERKAAILKTVLVPMYGLARGFGEVRDALTDAAKAGQQAGFQWLDTRVKVADVAVALEDATVAEDDRTEAVKRGTGTAQAYIAEQQKLLSELNKQLEARGKLFNLVEEMQAGELSAEEKVTAAYNRRLESIYALMEAMGEKLDMDLLMEANDAAEMERAQRLDAIWRDAWEADLAATQVSLRATLQAEQEKQRAIEETARIAQARALAEAQGVMEAASAVIGAGQAVLEAAGVNAEKAHKINQGLAYAQIGIDTAAGIMASIATLGPPVPPNVLGIAGVAAVLAAGVASAVAVAAQPAPAIHDTGGIVGGVGHMPDHRPITAQDGEALLDRRTTRDLGREGVEAIQSGRWQQGGQELSINFEGRTLDRMVSRVARGRTAVGRMLRHQARLGFAEAY